MDKMLLFGCLLLMPALVAAEDYCNSATFEATCAESEVVVIQNATYGRMEIGTCVNRDFGFLGCQRDVRAILDGRCSGRRSCSVPVADPQLDAVSACDAEFKSYLSATYTCRPVVHMPGCHPADRIPLTAPSGVLSSVLTEETQCGSDIRPWYIRAAKGQKVNFTLIDFNVQHQQPATCKMYAVITEKSTNERQEVCGGKKRQAHVYTTSGNDAEVRIIRLNSQQLTSATYFLLEYTVVGCPDLSLPNGTLFERHGDTAFVHCPGQPRKHRLHCQGNQWTGKYKNCTRGAGNSSDRNSPSLDAVAQPGSESWLPFSLDVSIALIFGVAFVISCCIFVVGIFIIRRQNAHRLRRQREAMIMMEPRDPSNPRDEALKYHDYPKSPQPYPFKDDPARQHAHPRPYLPQGHAQGRFQGQAPVENDYAYIADFPPPPTPKTLRKMEKSGKANMGAPSLGIHDFSTHNDILPLRSDLLSKNRVGYNMGTRFEDEIVDQRKSL